MPSYAITGASKGIGREFVRQIALQSPSNTVIAVVRDPESPSNRDLAQAHPNVHLVKGDVTDPQSILAAAEEAGGILGGKLDVFVHNSNAIDRPTFPLPPSKIPFDVEAARQFYDAPFRTAVYGGAWATNAFLPLVEKGSLKKIVHITSMMADTGVILNGGADYGVAYAVAKAGMNIQVAKYAVELAPKGIKTVAICPGWVDTFEGPNTPERAETIKAMLKQLQKIQPEVERQMTVEESIPPLLKVIESLDDARSGTAVQARYFKP
ncbi:hypothetical protein Trco_005033 [Trichoderma cornu-damae]|uniref:NAD(P)-binding protein n=1 Tax=Trichoderma cornu-damae TaxID=654480 RepID=A0A9P8QMC2_9HYPO|nr:hypothetical protein Trco_005033 [Trichoderma cornu-damae]